MHLYRRLLTYLKPYRFHLFVSVLCMLCYSACMAMLARLMKPMLDDVFINQDLYSLEYIVIAILVISFLKGIADYFQEYYMSFIGLSIVRDLRDEIYFHLQKLSLAYFTKNPTGLLISRITSDVGLIQQAVSDTVTSIAKDFLTVFGLVCLVIYQDWRLACMSFLAMPWAIIPIYQFGRRIRKLAVRGQEKMADLSIRLHETFTGNRIIKAFGMESFENKRFAKDNQGYFRYLLKRKKVKAISSPLMETFGIFILSLFILYGGYAVIKGNTTTGTFFANMTALSLLYGPVKRINKANQTVQEGLAGAERVFSVLDTDPDIMNRPDAIELPPIHDGIEFNNVSFAYENELVLKNINLRADVGQIVALVGPSGAGKSTLVNLLPRFYDVLDGRILIDGLDIRDITLRSLRANIGLVTQQTILFNETVRYNIGYGRPEISDEEIIRAARAANAHDFIEKLPNGYDTVIGEQGVKISGGEKQRLTIARAILKNAPILILDEATSSLDSESEIAVQKALENLMVNRTTFVIAHRLSTIKKAHKIVVIAQGSVVGEGTHEELITNNPLYKKLYQTQFMAYGEHQLVVAPTQTGEETPTATSSSLT